MNFKSSEFGWEPFGSVHGLLRCNIYAGVYARGRNGRVPQRCYNSPDGKRGHRVRVTPRTGSARRILRILKKSVELSPVSGEDGWLSLARGGLATGAHEMGCRWKSQNRKNVYLSPYVEPLNSKVIKSFVPELRSRKCFSCFEITPMFDVYIYKHYMSISHIRIWLWYTTRSVPLITRLAEVCSIYWIGTIRQNRNSFTSNSICRTPLWTVECGTWPFLRWFQSQGRSPDKPSIPKIPRASSAFSLKETPQTPDDKPSLSEKS